MSLRTGSKFALAAIVSAVLSAPTLASTVTFFQFQGDPDLFGSSKEIIYSSSTGMSAGPGAVGNGSFASPGLLGTITGGLPGVMSSPPGLGMAPPYYLLSDLTLVLTGFAPVGNAVVGAGSIAQDLGSGTFAFMHPAFSKPILAGTVSGALITEKKALPGPGPGDVASVLSGSVVYSDSVLEDSFAAKGLTNSGTFSFALSGLTGNYGTTMVNDFARLSSFSGDATGSFDANPAVVPAPAAVWGGISLVGLLGAARIKKWRNMSA